MLRTFRGLLLGINLGADFHVFLVHVGVFGRKIA
jgi:hypothetical protein